MGTQSRRKVRKTWPLWSPGERTFLGKGVANVSVVAERWSKMKTVLFWAMEVPVIFTKLFPVDKGITVLKYSVTSNTCLNFF